MAGVGRIDRALSPTTQASAAKWPFPYTSRDAKDKAAVSPRWLCGHSYNVCDCQRENEHTGLRTSGSTRFSGLSAAGQHPLGSINPLAEAILKRIVLLAFLNMVGDSRADDFGDWSAIDGRDHVQFLRLVGRQANRHRLDSLHSPSVSSGIVVVNRPDTVVSWYIAS